MKDACMGRGRSFLVVLDDDGEKKVEEDGMDDVDFVGVVFSSVEVVACLQDIQEELLLLSAILAVVLSVSEITELLPAALAG